MCENGKDAGEYSLAEEMRPTLDELRRRLGVILCQLSGEPDRKWRQRLKLRQKAIQKEITFLQRVIDEPQKVRGANPDRTIYDQGAEEAGRKARDTRATAGSPF